MIPFRENHHTARDDSLFTADFRLPISPFQTGSRFWLSPKLPLVHAFVFLLDPGRLKSLYIAKDIFSLIRGP